VPRKQRTVSSLFPFHKTWSEIERVMWRVTLLTLGIVLSNK
jgi:hypothetical protein